MRILICLGITFAVMTVPTCSSQQLPQGSGAEQRTKSAPTNAMMSMPLVAPLFVENGRLSSTMTVVNAVTAATTADVMILDQHGVQILKTTIKLAGHSRTVLKVADLLKKAQYAVSIGSIEIMPDQEAANNMSVLAQLSIVENVASKPVYLEEEFLMPSPKGSNRYQAAALSVSGKPVLALMSTSTSSQAVTVSCFAEKGKVTNDSRTLQIVPGQMVITPACEADRDEKLAFKDYWEQADRHDKGAVGISVVTNGMPGDLAVYGFAMREEKNGPDYTSLNFVDPAMLQSDEIVFTGVPVGQTELLRDSFKVAVAVTNFSTEPTSLKLIYARTEEGGATAQPLVDVMLAPLSSRTIQLPTLKGEPNIQNSFIIQSSAPPGTLAANLIATGDETSMKVESIGKDGSQTANGGAHPWTIEDGKSSTLLLFNHSDKAQSFNVNVSAGGVFWQQSYSLAASETKAIGINELIATQAKDKTGQIIPKSTTVGEVDWSVGGDGFASPGTGRILISNPDALLARSFSCGTQVVVCGLQLATFNLNLLINSGGTMGPVSEQYCITGWPSGHSCSGSHDYSQSVSANWGSSSPSIASVSGGDVTGVSPGITNITATVPGAACLVSTGTANVGCFAQLKYRAVEILGIEVGNHSFWWFGDKYGTRWVTDAGPTGNCVPNCGYLDSWITPGDIGHYAQDDAKSTAVAYYTPISPNVCQNSANLISFELGWQQDTIGYAAGAAPNSNTFAHDSANAAPFTITTPPPNAPGW
jgi:hypothetical protein